MGLFGRGQLYRLQPTALVYGRQVRAVQYRIGTQLYIRLLLLAGGDFLYSSQTMSLMSVVCFENTLYICNISDVLNFIDDIFYESVFAVLLRECGSFQNERINEQHSFLV